MSLGSFVIVAAVALASAFAFFPEVRGWVAKALGYKPDLRSIIGDLETKIEQLETHASELFEEARSHLENANVAKAMADLANTTAARATKIAENVKTFIAV